MKEKNPKYKKEEDFDSNILKSPESNEYDNLSQENV